ncbi:bifunctional 3-phenylpropionate/cinnamic acid dioxygenase ferredoxin subunit [Amycolatopsis rhabdoformis]|uniref:Bifunctional 3-phenylpropionate/cinnamic acid dioxygenase ferredoxin subunit n=1 Tax=Amycolatopsis rhabdoformis TaxID=1448059 RepID=A0ABZ1ILD7_9PSEU|nr:bifunctional 3-phenylpropionate/cinnamic acid dioxygenase ferredoxin subunit [Amycolatopsis rhabdoformis]WSE34581.1 bifunctional 3-phenylpropionate/cinnamic acid dioxygenase ferredoxin subunit [Amycolatopsis rhabdoformis]
MPENDPAAPTSQWVRACALDEVEEDEGHRLDTVPPVSLFRSGGEVFCLDDTCTHEDFSLAEGWVEDCVVECALHTAKFDLRSGKALSAPASTPVRVHEVRLEGTEIYVRLPETYDTSGVGK